MIDKIYSYKGSNYKVLDNCQLIRRGLWVDGVIYCRLDDLKRKYVREISDFTSKFTQV